MQILLVDDDDLTLRLTERILTSKGHAVLSAQGGKEALALADSVEEKIDLLVLDRMMPEMNGFETLEKLRAQGLRDVPVIMLTAMDRDDHILEGYQAGADYYLTKPFSPQSLLNIVDFLIGDVSDEEKRRLEALI